MHTEQTQSVASEDEFCEIHNRVGRIIKKELGLDLSTIDLDKDIRQQVYLDSLQLAELYAAVQAEFGIELPTSILAATTLREMLEAVRREVLGARTVANETPA